MDNDRRHPILQGARRRERLGLWLPEAMTPLLGNDPRRVRLGSGSALQFQGNLTSICGDLFKGGVAVSVGHGPVTPLVESVEGKSVQYVMDKGEGFPAPTRHVPSDFQSEGIMDLFFRVFDIDSNPTPSSRQVSTSHSISKQ